MSINYGQFAPGLADITPGRSGVLDNVVPLADDSYGPFPQLTTVVGATALDAAPVGIISFPKADGNSFCSPQIARNGIRFPQPARQHPSAPAIPFRLATVKALCGSVTIWSAQMSWTA